MRVVKSQKDRAWDGIKDAISRIRNARKNSDWPQIQDEFETANRLIEKSKMLIMRDGLPKFYIKMLAEVEDHVQIAVKDKETVKKMKPVVSRALNQMKLKVKKHNENYRTEILDYRENPSKYEEEEEEADSEEDDDDDDDSDSDDSDSAESSDADGSESEEDITKKPTVKKTTAKVIILRLSRDAMKFIISSY